MVDQLYEPYVPYTDSDDGQDVAVPRLTIQFSTLLLAFMTVLDALLFTSIIAHYPIYAELAVPDLDNGALIGFSRLYRAKISPKTILDTNSQNVAIPNLETAVSTENPPLLVDENTSTTMQFLVHEASGEIENCFLAVSFDEAGLPLDIWRLQDQDVSSSPTSRTAQPHGGQYIGSIPLVDETDTTSTYRLPSFVCPDLSTSQQTLEVTCSQPNCGEGSTTIRWEDGKLFLVQKKSI